ncbi:MAG: monovalent cation/H+ antiporter subunit D family protein [bacterium]|nr:monovalent cation/H+ antiporter subunit D family protein [bacterium]
MNQIISFLPLLALSIPLLGIIVILWVSERFPQSVNLLTALSTLLTAFAVATMYPTIRAGGSLTKSFVLFTAPQVGFIPLVFSFRVDALGFFVGLIATVVWMLSSFFAIEFMRKKHAQIRYDIFSLLTLIGMLGVVFAADLFTLYVFFELLSVASLVLVIHEQTQEAMRGGVIYIFMGICGGLILLMSILLTCSISGSTDIVAAGAGLKESRLLPLIFWGYILGFGVKAGIFPLHFWMPSAYPQTPTCAVALSSGVMIKAGAYGIIRTIYSIIGLDALRGRWLVPILLVAALVSIFVGSAAAINQKDIKKLLGYSSVSQIGYIILGLTLLSPLGLTAGIVHIFNHAIIKATLFLCAGAIFHQSGKRYLDELKGIGKSMPLITACFTMAALSMIGLPPFNGFISKWFLAAGALDAVKIGSYHLGVGILAVGTLIVSSFMNLIYYGPIVYNAWFGTQTYPSKDEAGQDPKPVMMIPVLLLALGTVIFGIFPGFPLSIAWRISQFYFH